MSMRIVMTFPYALGLPGGGPRDCIQTAHHLKKAGAEVTLLTVTSHSTSRFPRPLTKEPFLGEQEKAQLEGNAIQVIRVPQHPVHYMLDGLMVRKALQELLSKHPIDAVFGWHQEVAFLPKFLRSQGVLFGMISTMGNASEWYNGCHRFRKILRNLTVVRPMRQADVIFARSQFMRNLVIDLFDVQEQRVHVAYAGVDPLFSQTQRTNSNEVTRLIFFSRFNPEKGVFEALEALGKVAAQGRRNWTLKIAGWGDENQVRKVIQEQGIEDNVELLGHLDHSVLERELGWAHLAILPSHAESFGLAFAEAQASGLPVIGYDVGGVPEVVEKDVTAWLVPKGRVDLLAQSIIEAMDNPKRTFQMGLAGRERVIRMFTWQQTAETILRCVEEIKKKRETDN